ncbi:hypothetical protein XA68_11222 [Ophiocordyceps unilateralis]|uniref:Uncharacterized protein n=1 Tax=Ophiocordyceps unilateralis TaxID=268505 RepID=A0A2A9PQ05_OPHUN|nr:hypothetical protein XA68_11222 [Ophiocordyceps unilateralis]
MSRSSASMSANWGSVPQTRAVVTPHQPSRQQDRARHMTDSLARWLSEPEPRIVMLGAQCRPAREAGRK